jgi:biopolymer transport protein ExbB
MIKEFMLGGGVMWMLLACIVLGLAILLERMYSLFIKITLNPTVFLQRVLARVNEKGVKAGIALCDQTPSPVAKILEAGLEKADKGKDAIEEGISRAGAVELGFLDRGMALLAGLTTVAPFLGFLGTVTGMMKSFAAIAAAGEVEPTIVASGISEALITTKWGLLIATPLAIIHVLLTWKVDGYTRDMEEAAAGLVDHLIERDSRAIAEK